METNDGNTYLYLSTIYFDELSKIEELREYLFSIEILVALDPKEMETLYVDDVNQSNLFLHLNRKTTLPELCEILNKHDLIICEFSLRNQFLRIQSVVGSDLLIQVAGINEETETVLFNSLQQWKKNNPDANSELSERYKSDRLFEFSDDGKIIKEKVMPFPEYLVYWLGKDFDKNLSAQSNTKLKQRIYFSSPSNRE